MTKEEAINYLERSMAICEDDDSRYHNEVLEFIIKALEQEPILDKIRAEIVKKHLSIVEKNDFDSGRTYGYEEVMDIIDKYRNGEQK